MDFQKKEEFWEKILEIIKKRLGARTYNSWFSQVNIIEFNHDELVLAAPNDFYRDWLEKHYIELIKDILKNAFGLEEDINVKIRTIPQKLYKPPQSVKVKTTSVDPLTKNNESILNLKYTFDNFVVGTHNRFSQAACFSIAQSPAKSYNPLFLYGDVGLGKTHLIQAIGNYIIQHNKRIKVLYISSEKFTNELINSIRDDSTVSFRDKYRSVDVLLIDDIQFLAGKERTQEEFFHTFNTLYEANKQIVIASDRPPKAIPTLEDRLVSRFECGLMTDIQSPDYETRVAILKKKIENENLDISDEIIEYIANKIPDNIRKLEGALTKLIAYNNLTKKELSILVAQETLKDIIPLENKEISINQIQKVIAEYFNIKLNILLSKKRVKNIVTARHIAIYLSRELTDYSLPVIGEAFGGKDHTTILHSYNKIKEEREKDKILKSRLDDLARRIKNF